MVFAQLYHPCIAVCLFHPLLSLYTRTPPLGLPALPSFLHPFDIPSTFHRALRGPIRHGGRVTPRMPALTLVYGAQRKGLAVFQGS